MALLVASTGLAAAEEPSAPAGSWRLDSNGALVVAVTPPAQPAAVPLSAAECAVTWQTQLQSRKTCTDAATECARLWNAFAALKAKCASQAAAAAPPSAPPAVRALTRWDYRRYVLECLKVSAGDRKAC